MPGSYGQYQLVPVVMCPRCAPHAGGTERTGVPRVDDTAPGRGHAPAFKLRRCSGRDRVRAGGPFIGVQPEPAPTRRVAVAVVVVLSPRRKLCGVPSTWHRPTARRPGRRPRRSAGQPRTARRPGRRVVARREVEGTPHPARITCPHPRCNPASPRPARPARAFTERSNDPRIVYQSNCLSHLFQRSQPRPIHLLGWHENRGRGKRVPRSEQSSA